MGSPFPGMDPYLEAKDTQPSPPPPLRPLMAAWLAERAVSGQGAL